MNASLPESPLPAGGGEEKLVSASGRVDQLRFPNRQRSPMTGSPKSEHTVEPKIARKWFRQKSGFESMYDNLRHLCSLLPLDSIETHVLAFQTSEPRIHNDFGIDLTDAADRLVHVLTLFRFQLQR